MAHSGQCEARVGLMGNPSDGFQGKTLSFLVGNFRAEVEVNAEEHGGFVFHGAPGGDEDSKLAYLETLDAFRAKVAEPKWYASVDDGGISLCMATFSMLLRCLDGLKSTESVLRGRKGLSVKYKTSIPRCVGLSGSSAIITACWRSLMSFYGLNLSDIGITKEWLPSLILEIEKRELNIAAGLQDRVIQTYGGLVHMDFSSSGSSSTNSHGVAAAGEHINPLVQTLTHPGQYTSLSPSMLPPLYLIYNTNAGGDSGGVHSTVRERWQNRDPDLIAAMQKLGGLADEAVEALQNSDFKRLAVVMDTNFATRRATYGDEVVGALNVKVAEKAKELGLSAKFSGSGGAFISMRTSGEGFFDSEEEQSVMDTMKELGFAMARIEAAK